VDERCDSLLYRLMKVYRRGSFERSLPTAGMGRFDADTMVALMQRVIERPWDEKIRRVRMSGKSRS
jgi:hypothetical protein